MPLPPFLFTNTVSAETAKQDHVLVTCQPWLLRGASDDIDFLREHIAAPPEEEREGNADTVMEVWGRLFNRPQQRGNARGPLGIREESITAVSYTHLTLPTKRIV